MISSHHIDNLATRRFRRLALLTVIVVYLLILIGGIVRSTGSGMGCPDWPRCFGSWVPPTDVNQLPANYQEIFGAKLKGEVEFNALKTWIEYLNRLFGAFTGLLIFATLLAAVPYLKRDKNIFYLSFLAFLLVGFQGWLGSKVVSYELAPVMVTLHMLVAIIIVFVLLYVLMRSYYLSAGEVSKADVSLIKKWLYGAMALTLVQIVMGTQVREMMDEVMKAMGPDARSQWVDKLGEPFYIHRTFSWAVLLVHIGLIYSVFKKVPKSSIVYQMTVWLGFGVITEIIIGIVLSYMSVPAFAQPIHLTLAIMISGLQFMILMQLRTSPISPQLEKPFS
jgi:heme a synthase